MVVSEYHNGGNAEADEKQGLAALLAQSSPGIAITGVLYGLAVTQTATASGSVQISQGAGVVQASLTSGASLLTNPAPTLDVFTANPMGGLPRYDIVAFDALTATVKVFVGTPNATPTDPTVPNTALKLFRLRNGANATTIPNANMDDLRVYTRLAGTDVPAYSRRVQLQGKNVPDSAWTVVDGWAGLETANFTYASGVWTVQVPGRYAIGGQLVFGPNASPAGQRGVRLLQNGNLVHENAGRRADTVYNTYLPIVTSVNAAVGDTFSVQAYNSQGATQAIVTADGCCHISITRVSGT